MELLSPAGDEAALHAAVNAGADAVYLGYARFGARATAGNFDAEALEKAVAYAHLHHVRIHVTVNTLIKQGELEAVWDALGVIAACHADAVIVQDMGVARMVRQHFPTLDLHTSTQMGIHTAAGAQFAQDQGFARVVLARECSLATIAEVAATGVDTEVFVHGALCASVSGQCLLSSMAGGRSGNRGRCAQPCRQQVALRGHTAALLSMRDLCLRDDLPALQQAGVASLKIEGRLKRAEYVAVVTEHYRRALDALARGSFHPADAMERQDLLQIFHRGGFTRGYAMGAEDADCCATDRVSHGGVALGKIVSVQGRLANMALAMPMHDGDSLRVDAQTDVEIRYSGPEAQKQATLRLRDGDAVRVGDPVYRLADALQLTRAQAMPVKQIPISLKAVVHAGEPLVLAASDGHTVVQVWGELAQFPKTRPLTQEEIARSLARLGDTPYVLAENPTVDTDGAFIPVAALNRLRRDALERLSAERSAAFFSPAKVAALAQTARQAYDPQGTAAQTQTKTEAAPAALTDIPKADIYPSAGAWVGDHQTAAKAGCIGPQTLAVRFGDAALGKDFTALGANLLQYAPRDWRVPELEKGLRQLPEGVWLELPPQMSDAVFRQGWPVLLQYREKLAGIVLGSVGQLGFPITMPVALGDGVPIANREAAAALLRKPIAFYTLWPELSREELAAIGRTVVPGLLPVYGRQRVMLLNHCPERVRLGLHSGRATCALCKPEDRACASPDAALTDRRGYRFPLTRMRMPEGCVVEVVNALPTDLSQQEAAREKLGVGRLLRFTVETAEEQRAIVAHFAMHTQGKAKLQGEGTTTSGHFLRGVE